MSTVAVVILNYNGKPYLEQFLPSIIAHSTEAEIVVADNASSDNSVTFLKENYASITLIEFSENHGFAGGYNLALSKVDADYYVLLNSDVEVSKRWLAPLARFLDTNKEYAACQPKILDYEHKDQFEYAGAAGGFLDRLGYPYCRGRILDTLEQDHGQYDDPVDIFWSTGACMMIRSEVFHTVGGLDQELFAHMEEIDLCWRLYNRGWKIRCLPESNVYHVGGGTLNQNSPFKTFLNFRNSLLVNIKNMPMRELLWKLPVRVLLDYVAILKFILEGRPKHAWSVVKAHGQVVVRMRRYLKERESARHRWHSGLSIVWQYYVRGKRKYSNL